jgi:hypothetical protein
VQGLLAGRYRANYGFDKYDNPQTERGARLQKTVEDTTPHWLIGKYRLAQFDHVFDGKAKRAHHVRRYAL